MFLTISTTIFFFRESDDIPTRERTRGRQYNRAPKDIIHSNLINVCITERVYRAEQGKGEDEALLAEKVAVEDEESDAAYYYSTYRVSTTRLAVCTSALCSTPTLFPCAAAAAAALHEMLFGK